MHAQRNFYYSLIASTVCAFGAPTVLAQDSDAEESVLEEVIITGQRQAYRGDVALEDLPQAVQVLDSDLLVQIGAIQFQSILDYAGGVARQNSFGGLWDAFAIRGFAGDENLPSGYLVNGFSAGRGYSGMRDSANIESVEILKGPGSALFGRGEPGGTINIVTKKPQFEKEGYVMASYGSWGTYRVEADYTAPLSDTVAFRINGGYDDAGSFRDVLDSKRYAISPSILWLISDSTSLAYELEMLDQEAPFDRGIVVHPLDNFNFIPISRFLGEYQDGLMSVEATGHQLTLQHDLSNGWSMLAGLSYRDSSFGGFSTSPELSSGRQLLPTDDTTLTRQRRHRDYNAEDFSGRFEAAGSFDTGNVTHHILVGADAYDYELDTIQQRWRVGWNSGDTTYSINIHDPVYGQDQQPMGIITNRLEDQQNVGVFIQDQIDITDQFKVTIGMRFDDFKQTILDRRNDKTTKQSQTQLSPRFGLAYDVNDSMTLYGAYSQGFRPNVGADIDGVAFEPEESESIEVGAKFSWFDDRLSSTVAIFQATKNNIITADPVNGGSITAGEAESQGIEFDLSGDLSDTLHLLFTYAYIDAEITKSNNLVVGSPLINIPKHSANVLLVKDFYFDESKFDVGMSVQYVDERVGQTKNPDYILPSYTLARLMLGWEPSAKIRVSGEVNNLFDKKYFPSSYWNYWTMPGAPRNYTVRVRYSF